MSREQVQALLRRLASGASYTPQFSVEHARRHWYAYTDAYALPEGLDLRTEQVAGREFEWLRRPAAPEDRVLLYLHGGGYVCGSPRSHRPITAAAARVFDGAVASLDYRLAPEHPCPAAVEDAVAAVESLYRRGIAPARIALGGESAGAGLALATLLALRERDRPLPAAAWLVSPWLDLTNSGESIAGNAARDPIVFRQALETTARLYLGPRSPRDPLASPLHGDLRGLPPLFVQVGSGEILLDDALRLARTAGLADTSVTLQVWPDMPHAWHIFPDDLDEAGAATADAMHWLRARLR